MKIVAALLLLSWALVACSDASGIDGMERHNNPLPVPSGVPGDPGNETSPPPTQPPSTTSSPSANAFTGAVAFVAKNGPSTLKGSEHPWANGNPAKQDCLSGGCHGAGGGGPRFLAGGTVYQDLAGTIPAAQVEIRFRDAAGNAITTNTDANGNFFIRDSAAVVVAIPSSVGVRNAVTTRLMAATAGGACNSAACHGGAQGAIHLP